MCNIDAGLKYIDEQIKLPHNAHDYLILKIIASILEAMKEPSCESIMSDIERRVEELEKINHNRSYMQEKLKPSVPEKPRHTDKDLDLLVEKIRGSNRPKPDTISIPRDVAERFIKDSERKETNIYIGYFINAIKQALKGE